MIVTVIDPPTGWRYGFPKVIPDSELPNIGEWLISEGYPAEDIEFAVQYLRMWHEDTDDWDDE